MIDRGSYKHQVDVRVGSKVIENWTSYDISLDMLQPADAFSLSIGPASQEAYELVAPDTEVQILVDGVVVLTGYVDDRDGVAEPGSGSVVTITGRDKGGRLVDETLDLVRFGGIGIKELAEAVARPWFPSVTLSNATNRRLVRGGKTLAKVSAEPAILNTKGAPRKVEPGQKRWEVLAQFLERAELMAWSSADGKQLIVGLPNYRQEPQYVFVRSRQRQDESNCLSVSIKDSVGERYSEITVVGMARSDDPLEESQERYIACKATAYALPGTFQRDKKLVIAADDIEDGKACQARADYEMSIRESGGHRVELTVAGHGQRYRANEPPALYAPDTMCVFEDDEFGVRGAYLLTGVRFTKSRSQGTTSRIQLVRSGATLRI